MHSIPLRNRPLIIVPAVLILIGMASFVAGVLGSHPERAWQAYLINFLLWSSMAQGALVFSAVMHITGARWGRTLTLLSESFAAFFPFSLVLFVLLFLGGNHVFPWLSRDLHANGGWFHLPYLFSRDFAALLILYGLGLAYLYYALRLRREHIQPRGTIGTCLLYTSDAADE